LSIAIYTHIEENPKLSESLVKSFLDIIVLSMLNGEPSHGYKIIADLHKTARRRIQ